MCNLIKSTGRRFLLSSLAFLITTFFLIGEPKAFNLAGKEYTIQVYVEEPFKSYKITKRYIEDVKKLPIYLQRNIESISIEDLDEAYTKNEDLHLSESEYISDVVKHESIHVLDNATKATANSEFSQSLEKDNYIIDDSYDEIFVTVMFYYLEDKDNVKELMPNTFKYIRKVIQKAT